MATRTWTGGANDGNLNTAGNWSDATTPIAGDSIIIDATSQNITTMFSAAFEVVDVTITAGYSGNIETTAGAGMNFTNITGRIKYAGSGAIFRLTCSGTVDEAYFEHTAGKAYLAAGTYTVLDNGPGALDIAAASVVATLRNVGGNVTIGDSATIMAACTTMNGASVESARHATTLNVKGGVYKQTGTRATVTANVENGAHFIDNSTGTLTTLNAFSGARYSLAGIKGDKTITTRNKYRGATVQEAASGVTITITTRNQIGGDSGSDPA